MFCGISSTMVREGQNTRMHDYWFSKYITNKSDFVKS
jgi:hypothetical protein